jgi:DNA-binding transcriptional LysR family regulator
LPGFTGRSNIEKSFRNAGLPLNITLSAADSDIIKTYVKLGLGVGIIASMAYDSNLDIDLVEIDLTNLIKQSVTKIAYLKELYLPGYLQYFINELIKQSSNLHR